MAAYYEVVSDVPVREGKSLTASKTGTLGAGAVITETSKDGERLQYKKASGSGPDAGWVSTKVLRKIPAAKEAPKEYVGKSALAVAEATIMKEGAVKAMQSKGSDGPSLLLVTVALLSTGRYEEAFEKASAAVAAFKGNKDGEASAKLALASACIAKDSMAEAVAAGTEALGAYKELGDRQMVASAQTALANARIALKEIGAATMAVREALTTFREIGDADGEREAEMTLTDIYIAREGFEKGTKAVAAEKVAFLKQKGDKKGEAAVLQRMALAEVKGEDLKEAVRLAGEAVEIYRALGDKRLLASGLVTAASASLVRGGDADEGVKLATEALALSKGEKDSPGQASALNALTNAHVSKGSFSEALESSTQAQSLSKSAGDKLSLAQAVHLGATVYLAKGDASDALSQAKESIALFEAEGDMAGEATAMQTAASALISMGGDDKKNSALAMAKDALALFQLVGDLRGQAVTLYMLAAMQLTTEGAALDALTAAERARSIFITLGDKKYQALAAHAVAQANLLMGEVEFGMSAAMQAVVLSRDVGDKWTEASSLFTATNGQIAQGHLAEGLRMAREVQGLFKGLGSEEGEACAESLVLKIEDALPSKVPGPRTFISPMDDTRLGAQRSLFQEHPNCVIWTPAMNQQTYIMYSLELLKLVDDLKNMSTKTSVLAVSQGTLGRQTGEVIPGKMEAIYGNSLWAMVRTVRLESPRLHIASVDVPTGSSAYEIVECLRAAQLDTGTRQEVSYILDRKNKLKK